MYQVQQALHCVAQTKEVVILDSPIQTAAGVLKVFKLILRHKKKGRAGAPLKKPLPFNLNELHNRSN